MVVAETKSTHSQQPNTAESAEKDTAFFSEQTSEISPFFPANASSSIQAKLDAGQTSFFQPTRAPAVSVQPKCATCKAESSLNEKIDIQRMPAFESEADDSVQALLQRKPAFESESEPDVQPQLSLQQQAEPEPEVEEAPDTEADLRAKLTDNPVAPPTDSGEDDETSQPFLQAKLTMGQPGDRYEREADAMADQVTSQATHQNPSQPLATSPALQQAIQRLETLLQKAESGQKAPTSTSNFESRLQSSKGSGTPLDRQTRTDMEAGFSADFSGVRIHTGSESASMNQSISAKAFTHGSDIFFNAGEYQPQTQSGKHLLAHELTHTLQQGAAVQRQPVISSTQHDVQAYIPGFIADELNDYARHIPGYTLFTVAIGFNPLTGNRVDRNAMNLLEGLMGLVPFGTAIFDKLREYGILQDAFRWVEGELDRLDLSINRIENTIEAAWDEMELIEGFDYNLRILERHFVRLYEDVKAFAKSLVDHIIELIRAAAIDFLEPLLADNQAWELLKKILHYDPLRDEAVEATTAEILEDFLLLIGKEQELEKMKEEGTLQRTADWLDTQIATFEALLGELQSIFTAAIEAIRPENLPNLTTNLESLSTRIDSFLERVWTFATTVAETVLEFIKDALLNVLRSYATDETPGYPLLTVILGRDPFTQERVPRTPTNLIKGFMSLMPGGIQQFNQLQETGVIPRAAERIESMMSELGITWPFVQELFLSIWDSLTIEDLLSPIDTFIRILNQFREPLNRLFTFVIEVIKVVLELVLEIMNFPSDILANIINNALQALDDIQRDPVGFLLNMLEAVKLGFTNFFDNIISHLGVGLQDWFFAQLEKAGIQPPTDVSLESILDLVLQILGVSMDQIWAKLADRIGQENVDRIRGAIDHLTGIWSFIKDAQEQGIGAIWQYIQSQISNLWDMVLQQAQEWILTRVIERVTTKLLSMLDPTGIMAVINSFVAFFNAIQSAVEYFRELLEIVNDWVSTIASVASGEVEPGAMKMEAGLVSSIPVAIGFLANQVGLGNLGEKIVEILAALRGYIDQALEWLFDQAVSAGQALLRSLGVGGSEEEPEGMEDVDPAVASQITAGLAAIPQKEAQFITGGKLAREEAEQVASEIRQEHPVFKVFVVVDGGDSWDYHYEINPEGDVNGDDRPGKEEGCPSPGTSAPGIDSKATHGAQPPRNYDGPSLHHTQSEHIIPFATARSLRIAVSLPGRARQELGQFDRGMITLMIYRGAAENKNNEDNRLSAEFEEKMSEAQISERIRRGKRLYELGDKSGGESLVADALSRVSRALEELRQSAVSRTNTLIESEWGTQEPGCEETNGARRGEASPIPNEDRVIEASSEQYDGIFDLVRAALEDIEAEAERSSFEGRSINESGILDEIEQAGYGFPEWRESKNSWHIRVPRGSGLPRLVVDSNEILHYQ